ncbi:Cyclic di-GMP phosphodiesterase [Patescibacteria group bacterium]|nr:Cyclic di-GMP phosphodiesterase [Patescibacteria group bacterium]
MDEFVSSSIVPTKIDVRDLQIGMYVSQLDKPWTESPFLFQGFELKTQADVDAVRKECQYVYIDVEKKETYSRHHSKSSQTHQKKSFFNFFSKPNPTASNKHYSRVTVTPAPRVSFIQEIDHATHTHRETSNLVRSFMEDVQLGRAINVAMAKKVVSHCVDSILHSPDALLLMSQLKKRDEYTAQHSMNVCILSITLARQIGLSPEELNNIGLCGMMHDMGKMKVPLDILNKPDKLNDKEMLIMQSHAIEGSKILMSTKEIYTGTVDVAMKHHERLDGQGYPKGLAGKLIPLYTRIVTIADVYDAISSDRVYQKGRTHLETINIMTKMCDLHLDRQLTLKFIEAIGIYPPGNVVELKSGEVAVVMETNPKNKLKPRILLLLNENKQPKPVEFVDLAMEEKIQVKDRTITQIVRPEKYNIDLTQYDFTNIVNGLLKK